MIATLGCNFCLSLSPSVKAIAQRNALRKSALRGDTKRELAGDDLDTVSRMHSLRMLRSVDLFRVCGDLYPVSPSHGVLFRAASIRS